MSWINQDRVYIIMFRSMKSGGTYTEVRRTNKGLERLISTLKYLGYREEDIIITEQKKAWTPDRRVNGKRKKVEKVVIDNVN